MNELWKNVVDYEENYQISNLGNFRRHPDNPREATYNYLINKLGYAYLSLYKDGRKRNRTIHQLVAAAFIPNFQYGQHINHIDGNKLNNAVTNLELSNPVHNNTHAHTLPTTTKPGKSKYRNVSIRVDKRNKNLIEEYHASVKINSKRHYIGRFASEIDAAKAVDAYLDSIGDTSRIRNFP